jgi:perosamine synthetase
MIPYGHQSIDEDDIEAVVRVLRSDWLTQGPAVEEFEARLAEVTGARFAVAFSSGTAALHGAAAVSGLGSGDLVVTSPLSFVASANCARYVGATVGFVDIDPETLNLDPEQVPRCDGLVAVHYAGLPVDLTALKNRPRVVIEDAAHALGATTPDGPVGNCAHSDMCAFSFHPVKAITTGEGGAVTTNSAQLAEDLRRFRSHGIVHESSVSPWYYDVASLGYNNRLTDIQAALGTGQLNKLGTFVRRRNDLAEQYRSRLADLNLSFPPGAPEGWCHAYHLFTIRVSGRDRVLGELRDSGIGAQFHYPPIYAHSLYSDLGLSATDFPAADAACASLISLPLFPGLTDADQCRVVTALRTIL